MHIYAVYEIDLILIETQQYIDGRTRLSYETSLLSAITALDIDCFSRFPYREEKYFFSLYSH